MPIPLLAISNHGRIVGGGERSLIDFIHRLPSNWRPLVVVPEQGGVADHLQRRAIPFALRALPSIRPWRLGAMVRSLVQLVSLVRSSGASLIYANGSRAAFFGGWAGRLTRRPVIWHCRVIGPDRPLDALLAALCTRIIANSRATADRFGGPWQGRVSVVYNGIDIEWFRSPSAILPALADGRRKIILMVARRSRWKRHDLALAAFDMVAAAHPEAHLVCIGNPDQDDPAWERHMQHCLSALRYRHRVEWLGSMEDLRPWYQAATLSLLTSRNEAFGRVFVESMACGVPVVAMASGGAREVIRNGQEGFLIDTETPADVAAAITCLLRDEPLRQSLGRSALKRASEFDVSTHVRQMVGVFEDTLKMSLRAGAANVVPSDR